MNNAQKYFQCSKSAMRVSNRAETNAVAVIAAGIMNVVEYDSRKITMARNTVKHMT